MYNELGLPLKEEDLAHGSEKRYTYDILGRETSMSQTGYDTRYTKWDTPNKGDRTVIQGKKKVAHRLRDRSDGGAVLDRITEVYTLTRDGKQYFSIDRLGLEGRLLAQYEMGPQGEERLKYRYTYDALGRLLEKRYKEAEGNYGVERHQYFGNRTRVSTPLGHWTTYWCQRFADPDQCTVTKIRNAEDHETLIDRVTIPVDSRLTRPGGLKVTQGNQTLIDVEYLYDVLRVYEVNDHLPAQQHQHKFGYDGTDQLIYDKSPVGDWYYSYDDHGNITSQTYQGARTDYHYNALNRLSALSGNHAFDLSYDALGRVTSRDGVDLSYNAADLVTRMHKDGRTVEYRYDPYGKRYKIIEGDKTSLQLHLKHKLYYEKREGHEIDHVFLKGQHIANIKDNGETTYFFNNLIGSPLLESSDTGQQHQDYNAYGQEHERDTREPHTSFAGKQSSPGFGMVDMHARQYDPVIGRFLAPDPADIDPTKWLTVNRYVYANNSPYMFVDPDGAQVTLNPVLDFTQAIVGGVIGAYAGYRQTGNGWGLVYGGLIGGLTGLIANPLAAGAAATVATMGAGTLTQSFVAGATTIAVDVSGAMVGNKLLSGMTSSETALAGGIGGYVGGHMVNRANIPVKSIPQALLYTLHGRAWGELASQITAQIRPTPQNLSAGSVNMMPITRAATYIQPQTVSVAPKGWHAPMIYKG